LDDGWCLGEIGACGIKSKQGAIHWKTPDGDVAWLLVPGSGETNVKVSKTTMSLYAADPNMKQVELYICAKNTTADSFSDSRWTLPAMMMNVSTTLKKSPYRKSRFGLFSSTTRLFLTIAPNVIKNRLRRA